MPLFRLAFFVFFTLSLLSVSLKITLKCAGRFVWSVIKGFRGLGEPIKERKEDKKGKGKKGEEEEEEESVVYSALPERKRALLSLPLPSLVALSRHSLSSCFSGPRNKCRFRRTGVVK